MTRSALETPMMKQFLAIKAGCPDAILFYRMGDFYEMFLEDAELAAPLLDIALTTRDRGKPDAVPMCGVPVHAADAHIKRLTDLGHRVAVCEQVEDPKQTRKLVRREVVEVVTPGLTGDPAHLDAHLEVALAALLPGNGEEPAGLASLDASTGRFQATSVGGAEALPGALLEELVRIAPREVLVPATARERVAGRVGSVLPGVALTAVADESFAPEGAPAAPAGFRPESGDPAMGAAAALLRYVARNQPFALEQTPRLRVYALGDAMILDAATRAHLELFESSEDRSRRHTLIERLDETSTPLGARRLARWIAYPLLDPASIGARQDAVAWLCERDRPRARLRAALGEVRDLERLLSKAARPGATPRDLAALRASVAALPGVCAALAEPGEAEGLLDAAGLPAALQPPEPVPAVAALLADALVDEPKAVPRGSRGASETGYIRAGFRAELDGLRESASKGREWIAGLEARERERIGVPSLKARFHPVHGYSLEVTKTHLERVPGDYERKQTLANCERFTTPELREMESKVLGAHDRAAVLEREIFEAVRLEVLGHGASLRAAAEAVADLDALAALAEVARRDGWARPVVDEGTRLVVRGGRHPVVERNLQRAGGDGFVPNDTELDPAATQILLITGPNMSGKSTYLRQVALIVLLAQIGSFVPAESAHVGVVDRVFTRVGASDRLARGESTFMVEMRETAEILAQASERSLVILDEIGRGTSTYDGLSIAWAVAEYLHDTPALGARTLFATHYHELADLAATRARVANGHFEAREWGDDVVFLRRLVAGEANRSYGIQVARLAGLPDAVIGRAREILRTIEAGEFDSRGRPRLADAARPDDQLALFQRDPATEPPGLPPAGRNRAAAAREEVAETIRALDLDGTTPIDALLTLRALRAVLEEEGDA